MYSLVTIESLEPRTLLSGTSAPALHFAFVGPPPIAPALVVPFAVLPLATTTSTASTAAGQALPAAADGSRPAIVPPHIQVVILAPDASMDSVNAGVSGPASDSSVDLRRIVNLGNLTPGVTRPAVFDMDGHAPAVANETEWNAPTEVAGADAAAPSGPAGPNVVSLPSEPRMEVEGSFDPAEGVLTVQIPVGPMTQSIRVVLHPPLGLPDGQAAVFGQISLIDPSGLTLAQIDPDAGNPGPLPQDLTVAMQNPPAGGQLVVRLTGVQGAPSAAGSQSPSTLQSNVPFVLDVQSESQPSGETSAATTEQPGWVGTLAVTSAGSTSQPSQPGSSASTGDSSSDLAISDQTTEVPQSSVPVNDGSGNSDSDGYYVRMATGPLVSRSSGPLGPVLAASGADLTPPVDRHERALFQEIPNLNRENDSENSLDSAGTGRLAMAQVEDDSARSGPEPGERHVTVVLGAGGFPMKVTSRSVGDRAGLAGLLAALPQPDQPPSPVPSDSQSGSLAATPVPPVELTAQVSYRADRRGYPDYLKAAWALVLGLGLTSGPLFSDLITSFRRKTSRWRPVARAGKSGDGSAA